MSNDYDPFWSPSQRSVNAKLAALCEALGINARAVSMEAPADSRIALTDVARYRSQVSWSKSAIFNHRAEVVIMPGDDRSLVAERLMIAVQEGHPLLYSTQVSRPRDVADKSDAPENLFSVYTASMHWYERGAYRIQELNYRRLYLDIMASKVLDLC